MSATVPRAVRRIYKAGPADDVLTFVARVLHPRAGFWFHTARRGYQSVAICYLCDRLVVGWNGGSAPPAPVASRLHLHRVAELAARNLTS